MRSLNPRNWGLDEYPPRLFGTPQPFPDPVNLDSIRNWPPYWSDDGAPKKMATIKVRDSTPDVTSKGSPCMKLRIEEPGFPELKAAAAVEEPVRIGHRHIWVHGGNLHKLQFMPMHEVINEMVAQDGYCLLRARLRKAYATGRFYRYIYNHRVTGASHLQAKVSMAVAQVIAEKYEIPDPQGLLRKKSEVKENPEPL